ncbi:3D domain-containing protein [Paenibacillus sp. FSL L8-0435]|uniref:3D domain-containing protein n=1 Tax=Paenibacillus sp. FSL L8-0435 TaxID=2954618 RepID=UPI0030DB92F6
MLEVLLSLLLALSIGQAGLESANQAREAKNTTKIESVKVEKSAESKVVEKEAKQVKATSSKKSNDEYDWMYFEISAYTNGKESTGKVKGDKNYGITASGAHTKEGVTVSADPKVLPMGTKIYIEGIGERIVQDTGSAIKGKKLDLFIEDLDTALEFGRKKNIRVRIID